jgi:glycosyltransferase involved in cell wall biosynthesis
MNPNYIKGLSIIIPSYNRQQQLCRLLDSIFTEDISDLYEIVVVDNNSDYDIHEVLHNYPKEKLRIVSNVFNIHMATNMMSTFLQCRTKWMWLISDDDVVCENSIVHINNRIRENEDVAYLKFSTEGTKNIGIERENSVNNLEEFIDYYAGEKPIRTGNLIFVSNGVFNLEKLNPYLGYGFEFSYTYVCFLIPVFFALNNNISVSFFKEKIISYSNPGQGMWSFRTVSLGLSTLSHLPLSLNKYYFRNFIKIMMPITYLRLFKFFLQNVKKNDSELYRLVYDNSYKFYLTALQKLNYRLLSILLNYPKIAKLLVNLIGK